MEYEIGKVVEYDGIKGTLVTLNTKYMFLSDDVNEEINVGDLVKFRGEEVQDTNRAYFVKMLHYNTELHKRYVKDNK